MALTLVVAIASWHLLERPFLSLQRWFCYDTNNAGLNGYATTPAEIEVSLVRS